VSAKPKKDTDADIQWEWGDCACCGQLHRVEIVEVPVGEREVAIASIVLPTGRTKSVLVCPLCSMKIRAGLLLIEGDEGDTFVDRSGQPYPDNAWKPRLNI